MKKIYLLSILALSVLFSCQKEENFAGTNQSDVKTTIIASFGDSAETKTAAEATDNGYKTIWSENDDFSYFQPYGHGKFVFVKYLTDQDGNIDNTKALFTMTQGSASGGIEGAPDSEMPTNVAIYPYSESTTVTNLNNEESDFEVHTVIPTIQTYAPNSFGQGAAPMVAVKTGYDMSLSFKNVASAMVMPIKGQELITKVTLESKKHNIGGNITVIANETNDPVTTVNDKGNGGESLITLYCGDGVQLKEDVATNFFITLAPGTYEANDLVVTFYDSIGKFFTTEITAENTFNRSKTLKFGARTFKEMGATTVDLIVKAKALVYQDGVRIVPSLTNLNFKEWITNLVNHEDPSALLSEINSYLKLKNYKAAYDALGGLPGFVTDSIRFEAVGMGSKIVDPSGLSYIDSMLADLENVTTIDGLVAYLEEFDKLGHATGATHKLDSLLGSIDGYIDEFFKGNKKTEDATARATISATILKHRTFLVEHYSNEKYKEYDDVLDNLNKYVINSDNKIEDVYTKLRNTTLDPLTTTRKTLFGGEKTVTYYGFNGSDVRLDAIRVVEALEYVKDGVYGFSKAALKEIRGKSIVDVFQDAVKDKDGIAYKFLVAVFESGESSLIQSWIIPTLRTIVQEIEEKTNNANLSALDNAINLATIDAIVNARMNGEDNVLNVIEKTNDDIISELYSGPWGIFQKVLNWKECAEFFETIRATSIYNALLELSTFVEDMVVYDAQGLPVYEKKEFEEYIKNVDYTVTPLSSEFQN